MKRSWYAFSLVELLVVIAITAILTAAALPSYKAYIVRQKIASVTPFLDQIAAKMKVYYAQHGTWPNWSQIGYPGQDPYGGISPNSIVPTVSPYLVQYTGQYSGLMIGTVPATGCNPTPGMVSAVFDGRKLDNTSVLFNAQWNNNNGDHDILIYSYVLYPTNNGTVISVFCGAYGPTMGEESYLPKNCQQGFVNNPVTCS